MVHLTQEDVDRFNDTFEKEFGTKYSNEEAWEATHNLVGFFKLLTEIEIENLKRKERLKTEPKGFHLEDGPYNCRICSTYVNGEDSWYDKYGIKCLDCQRAQEKKIIPVSAVKDTDSWFSSCQLKDKLGIRYQTAQKLIREKKLKARTVLNDNGGVHFQIFLIKDNEGFFKSMKSV